MEKATKATEAVKTEFLRTPGSLTELFNLLILHELLNVKEKPQTGTPTDPTHKKDQKNELAVAQFRIFFKKEKPELSDILDQIFVIIKTSDYRHFSLSVLESASASAYAKYDPADENNIGPEKPYFLEKITTSSGGDKGEKPKQAMVVFPNFHYQENYRHFINLIATAITNNDSDPKKTIRFLDECGIISQSVTSRLARHFTQENLTKFQRLFSELPGKLGQMINPLLDDLEPKTTALREQAKARFEAAKARRQSDKERKEIQT